MNRIPQAIPKVHMSEQIFIKFLCFFLLFLLRHFALFFAKFAIALIYICTLIWLKFGTRTEGLKAWITIKYGVNLINNEGVIRDLLHKAKSNFCHAYRVNHEPR